MQGRRLKDRGKALVVPPLTKEALVIALVKMSSSPLGGVMGIPLVGKDVRGKVLIIVVDKYQKVLFYKTSLFYKPWPWSKL